MIIEPVHEERYKFVIVEYGRLIQDDSAEAIEVKCIPSYLLHERGGSIISLCLSDLCKKRVWEKILAQLSASNSAITEKSKKFLSTPWMQRDCESLLDLRLALQKSEMPELCEYSPFFVHCTEYLCPHIFYTVFAVDGRGWLASMVLLSTQID